MKLKISLGRDPTLITTLPHQLRSLMRAHDVRDCTVPWDRLVDDKDNETFVVYVHVYGNLSQKKTDELRQAIVDFCKSAYPSLVVTDD